MTPHKFLSARYYHFLCITICILTFNVCTNVSPKKFSAVITVRQQYILIVICHVPKMRQYFLVIKGYNDLEKPLKCGLVLEISSTEWSIPYKSLLNDVNLCDIYINVYEVSFKVSDIWNDKCITLYVIYFG
jgi:hypothetical protein